MLGNRAYLVGVREIPAVDALVRCVQVALCEPNESPAPQPPSGLCKVGGTSKTDLLIRSCEFADDLVVH